VTVKKPTVVTTAPVSVTTVRDRIKGERTSLREDHASHLGNLLWVLALDLFGRNSPETLPPPSLPIQNDAQPVLQRRNMRLGKSASVGQKHLDGGDGRSRQAIISCANVFDGSGCGRRSERGCPGPTGANYLTVFSSILCKDFVQATTALTEEAGAGGQAPAPRGRPAKVVGPVPKKK
jgi:hypothetical protein